MPASRRIIVTVSESLLSEVDNVTVLESKNRSQIIREAIKFYLGERKRVLIKEQMKKGYMEMSDINLSLASEEYGIDEKNITNGVEKLLE
ncbi:MAG: ribbon-helix-helix protein, CopG family [Syntrophomonadaceae bacterium]|nr:ribbon-helix-helix protein, CopG family [Syntrophomonadaceae bacterium]